MFYLFLSSRELFHTNFWLWLSEVNKKEAVKLFTSKILSNDVQFKREYSQKFGEIKAKIDLYIEASVVVENKVKDFPTSDQMQRIKYVFQGKDVEFVLTTLFWFDDLRFEDWTIKTYRSISEDIIPNQFTSDNYHLSLITDYKSFLMNLAELAEQLAIKYEYNFAIAFETEVYRQLNGIRLWEGYQKMRASHLLYQFKKHNIHQVKTGYSINNQKATIDFVVQITDDYSVGIQIENNQYRKFVSGKNASGFAHELIRSNKFLNPRFHGRGNKPFLNYGEHFKYQYELIEQILTFQVLFARVNNDIAQILADKNHLISLIP